MTNKEEIILYERPEHYIPRVAAIHDLCGYGKCSLGVAIPVLSAAVCDVCPVPTGLFSNHTGYPDWYMHDTTEILNDYLDTWKKIDIDVDAIYSGFLGSDEQVEVIKSVYETYPNALKVVYPVMADHGQVYPTYNDDLCQAMASLACETDILTPNLTEAAIILGEPIGEEWGGTNIDDDEAHRILNALLDLGAKYVVLKGIQRDDGIIRNFVGGKDMDIVEASNEFLPYMLHGTGDLYASALLAAVMVGKNLEDAVKFAGNITHDAMIVSSKQPNFQDRGVNFESLLGQVTDLFI